MLKSCIHSYLDLKIVCCTGASLNFMNRNAVPLYEEQFLPWTLRWSNMK